MSIFLAESDRLFIESIKDLPSLQVTGRGCISVDTKEMVRNRRNMFDKYFEKAERLTKSKLMMGGVER